jgi:hypothetical protein
MQESVRPLVMADHLSSGIRLEYKKLQGVAHETQLEFFDAKHRFLPGSSGVTRLSREWADRVSQTTKQGLQYLQTGLPDIYTQAALAANPEFVAGDAEHAALRSLQLEAGRGLSDMDKYAKRDVRRFLDEAYDIGADKSEKYLQRNGIKGIRYSGYLVDRREDGTEVHVAPRHTVGNYSDMLLRSNAARTWNSGSLAGMGQAGIAVVEVSDGADCGWEFHRDSEKASGKLVTVEEALDHLIAHPYCVRQFTARPDLNKEDKDAKRLSKVQKAAITATAAVAGLGIMNLVADMANAQLQAVLRTAAKKDPRFQLFDAAVTQLKQRLESAAKAPAGQLYDFVSGLPIVENEEQLSYYFQQAQTKMGTTANELDLTDLVLRYQDDLLAGHRVPDFVLQALNLDDEAISSIKNVWLNNEVSGAVPFPLAIGESSPLYAAGDAMDAFSAYRDAKYGFQGMAGDGTFTQWLNASGSLQDQFFKAVGGTGPDYAKFSLPKIGGERGKRVSFMTPDGLLKFTSTKTKDRVINRLTFNRNGMLRAGFTTDPESGHIIPSLRLIPKGPLRVHTIVNRSRTGKVLSVSGDISTRFKLPIDYNAHFLLKLEKLNIKSFRDVLKLRPADIARLKAEEPELWTWAKSASEIRMMSYNQGFNMQPINLARINQVGWDNAKTLWEFSNTYIRDQAEFLRKKIYEAPAKPSPYDVENVVSLIRDGFENNDVYDRIINWSLVDIQEKLKMAPPQAKALLERARIASKYRLQQLEAVLRGKPAPPLPGKPIVSNYYQAKDAGVHQVGGLRGNPKMIQDARIVGNLFDDRYPSLKSLPFEVDTSGEVRGDVVAAYFPDHSVRINPMAAIQWDTTYEGYARSLMERGFWAPGPLDAANMTVLVHEFAHAIYPGTIRFLDLVPLFEKLNKLDLWITKMPVVDGMPLMNEEWFKAQTGVIMQNLSGYAADSIWEFLAEAMTEYLSSPNPRPIAKVVGKYTDSILLRKRF